MSEDLRVIAANVKEWREQDRTKDMAERQAYLMAVDAIERKWGIAPRTAELRKERKQPERSGIAAQGQPPQGL